jgi:hypothetical protein
VKRDAHLPQIVLALSSGGRNPRGLSGWKDQRNPHHHDPDHDEDFNPDNSSSVPFPRPINRANFQLSERLSNKFFETEEGFDRLLISQLSLRGKNRPMTSGMPLPAKSAYGICDTKGIEYEQASLQTEPARDAQSVARLDRGKPRSGPHEESAVAASTQFSNAQKVLSGRRMQSQRVV